MRVLVILAAVLIEIQAISEFDLVKEQWTTFKMTYRKHYQSETEEKFRMKIYMHNKHKIHVHNQKYELGLVTFKLCMNQYGDMLRSEVVQALNGYNRTTHRQDENGLSENYATDGITFIPPANVELPNSIDWREKGAVTAVKNQRHCGSCWSFSATGSLEGQHFRKTGKLMSLSEQNLLDCSRHYGNHGCHGGSMKKAFNYVKNNHGIDTEKSYPYEGKDDKCRYNPKNSGATDRGYSSVKSRSEIELKAAVATVGPISVAIDASHHSFQFYCKGVYDEPKCSSARLDHAVLVVGYGTTYKGVDYWLVKNSWGTTWGNKGYILMSRNKNNQCGIASQASYPLV